MKNFIIGTLAVITLVSAAGNVLLYKRYSSSRPLVRVGSQVITKKQYQDSLDYATQGAILRKMVIADLIMQSAQNANVVPTDKDIDERIALIQRQEPQTLNEASINPAKMTDLRDKIRTELALENLRIHNVSVTDAQAAAFYNKHKTLFMMPKQVRTTTIVAENSVDADTAASLLKQNVPLDVIARQPRLKVAGLQGFIPNFDALPADQHQQLISAAYSMNLGEVKSVPIGKFFIVLKVNQMWSAGASPFAQVKPQAERMAKLERAPSAPQEIARLYHEGHIQFEIDKYATYFSDIQNAPQQSGAGEKMAQAR